MFIRQQQWMVHVLLRTWIWYNSCIFYSCDCISSISAYRSLILLSLLPAESVQWEPKSCYFCNDVGSVPMRTHGGLQCGKDGKLTIPFPKKPFCASGWKGLYFQNRLNHPVSEGHTVLPGFENIGYATLIKPNQTIPECKYFGRIESVIAANTYSR